MKQKFTLTENHLKLLRRDAAKASGLFSSILWIDRPGIPDDPTVKFTRADATDVIVNDETLTVFEARVLRWAESKGYL